MVTIAGRRYRRKHVIWLAVALVSLFLLAGVLLAGNGDQPPPPSMPITLFGGKFIGNRFVSKAWSLDYDKIVTSPDGTIVDVDGIKGGLLYKNGKPYVRFSAKHVSGNTVTLDLTVLGGIHAETIGAPIARSFDTESVVWSNGPQQLTIPHAVTIHSDGQIMHVAHATLDFKSGAIKFTGVRGDIKY